MLTQLLRGQCRYAYLSPRHISRIEDGIVMDDYNPVRGRAHIELDRVGAELDRALERRDGILGQCVVGAPVRDREACETAFGQVFLGGLQWERGQRTGGAEPGQSALTPTPLPRLLNET